MAATTAPFVATPFAVYGAYSGRPELGQLSVAMESGVIIAGLAVAALGVAVIAGRFSRAARAGVLYGLVSGIGLGAVGCLGNVARV